MKLLLDEMYSLEIAQLLRQRGYDVISVKERADLVGRSDVDLLTVMAREERVIVSDNARDFVPLTSRLVAAGSNHAGVILTSGRRLPRSRDTIGRFVKLLDGLLGAANAEPNLRNQIRWLR